MSSESELYKDRTVLEIMASPCGQCLFSGRKLVDEARKQELLAQCQATRTHFVCHVASHAGRDVMCRSFYDRFPGLTLAMKMAKELGLERFLTPKQARMVGPLHLVVKSKEIMK